MGFPWISLGLPIFAFDPLEIPNNAMHMPAQKHCNGSLEWISWQPNPHQFPRSRQRSERLTVVTLWCWSAVVNGFSDLILEVFGKERGAHARSAVGMAGLPFDIPVEIEGEVLLSEAGGTR